MRKKIMIVDDDSSILITIEELFRSEYFEVHMARSGKECISKLKNGFKGVILMDIMMPDMDGWDTIKEIVAKGYDEGNIISILTARENSHQRKNGLKKYVKDYIAKPFEPEELLKTVKEYFSYLE